MKLTRDRKQKFIRALARTGVVTAACKFAGCGRNTAYYQRGIDADFAIAWDEAAEMAADKLEREAWRRATGYWEPVIDKEGKRIARIKKYSDSLLILLLRAARPEKFRERTEVRHDGRQTVVVLRGEPPPVPPEEIDDGASA